MIQSSNNDGRVLLGLPWLKQTNPLTALSVILLRNPRRMGVLPSFGDAFIAHSRNKLGTAFLDSQFDWLLMLDDDMVIPCGDGRVFNSLTDLDLPEPFASFHAADRLLDAGKTLVGALYFGRHPFGAPMYGEGHVPQEAGYARKAPMNVVKPTRWVATGCLLIHRTVFEDIEKKFPELARCNGRPGNWFSSSEHDLQEGLAGLEGSLSFGPMTGEKALLALQAVQALRARSKRNSTLGLGEDVQFCTRAAAAGHQPHVDLGLVCGHVGASTVYGPRNTRIKLAQ